MREIFINIKQVLAFVIILILASLTFAGNNDLRDISKVGPRTEKVALEDYQGVFYVSNDLGSDISGEGSKQKPWQTLTHALSKLEDASESKIYVVLVAAGTYDSGTTEMQEHVDIFGGFSSQTWQRDIFLHTTILDGERARRVVVGANNARIDGFTITRGLARSHGGGILCDDTSPTISNNFITDNSVLEPEDFDYEHMYQNGNHGGGIASLYNAVPVIRNNVIYGNKTSIGIGGGVVFYGFLRMEGIIEPHFEDNFLTGGLQPVLENNVIIGNTSGVNDIRRSRSSSGGGVACAYEARPFIRNNIIANNRAKGRSDAGGIYSEFYSYPVIAGNWILGNVSDDDGGGVYVMRQGHAVVEENILAGNWTTGGGVGGVRLSKEGRARIANNLIVYNQSGGGVQCIDSYMELINNIIMHNEGGGALSYYMRFSYFRPSILRNNIMRDNSEEPIIIREDVGQPMLIENNNIEGGFKGKGNLDKDPGFRDDGMSGKVESIRFDPDQYTTTVVPSKPIAESDLLAGRVVRLGEKWGVIKEALNISIVIWGDISSAEGEGMEFEIIPSYGGK